MPWENDKPDDKTMEALRNQFSLENIMDSRVITDSTEIADLVNTMTDGQFRLVYTGGFLYKYTKYNGALYSTLFTAV